MLLLEERKWREGSELHSTGGATRQQWGINNSKQLLQMSWDEWNECFQTSKDKLSWCLLVAGYHILWIFSMSKPELAKSFHLFLWSKCPLGIKITNSRKKCIIFSYHLPWWWSAFMTQWKWKGGGRKERELFSEFTSAHNNPKEDTLITSHSK